MRGIGYMFWELRREWVVMRNEKGEGLWRCDTVYCAGEHAPRREEWREGGRRGGGFLNAAGAGDEERGRCATLIRAQKLLLLV